MTTNDKLTGGRKPFFIDSTDGVVSAHKFFLLVVLSDAVFTTLESKTSTAAAVVDERTDMNILAKTIKAGAVINCDGDGYFTKVTLASGLVAAYKALV